MNKIAAIDIGTNSVRLLIVEFVGALFNPILKCLETTRLGAGVDSRGFLSAASMDKTFRVVETFKEKAISMGAEDMFALATSAVRDALNGRDFIRRVENLGLKIEILSGEDEAKLGFSGASLVPGLTGKKIIAVDIGGGSTELILGKNHQIDFLTSIDIGAVRLTEKFIKNDPPTKEEIHAVKKYVNNKLKEIEHQISDKNIFMVGIGGTITSLAAITQQLTEYKRELIHKSILSKSMVERTMRRLVGIKLKEREKIPGLQPKRADIIIAGIVILDEIMDFLNQKSLMVSEWDNLEGAIYHKFIICEKITR